MHRLADARPLALSQVGGDQALLGFAAAADDDEVQLVRPEPVAQPQLADLGLDAAPAAPGGTIVSMFPRSPYVDMMSGYR